MILLPFVFFLLTLLAVWVGRPLIVSSMEHLGSSERSSKRLKLLGKVIYAGILGSLIPTVGYGYWAEGVILTPISAGLFAILSVIPVIGDASLFLSGFVLGARVLDSTLPGGVNAVISGGAQGENAAPFVAVTFIGIFGFFLATDWGRTYLNGILKGSILAPLRKVLTNIGVYKEESPPSKEAPPRNEYESAKKEIVVRHVVIDFARIIEAVKGKGIILNTIECPYCNGAVTIPASGEYFECKYCGKTIYATKIFDKLKDILSPM